MKQPISEAHHIDNMEYMKSIPDGFFELAIVDPPYGINVHQNYGIGNRNDKGKDEKKWDSGIPNDEYFVELRRVSKEQIIWGANYFNCFSGCHGAIIWDKMQPLPDSSQCEIASYSRLQKVGLYQQRWTNFVNTKESNHPTEKPVALYKWLLENYAKPGDKIFDSHLGSQSSRIAAYDLGFDFYGCELDADYYRDGCARFEAHRTKVTEIRELGYAKTVLNEKNPTLF
jgi:site-specific DNA-methyltransferase (adenine-specific)